MSIEKPLKSAVELAMERLRQRDAVDGIVAAPLTEAQKSAIAETRSYYEAKIAEQDVLFRSKLQQTYDAAGRDMLEQEFRVERARLTSERDTKIEKLRRGESL